MKKLIFTTGRIRAFHQAEATLNTQTQCQSDSFTTIFNLYLWAQAIVASSMEIRTVSFSNGATVSTLTMRAAPSSA